MSNLVQRLRESADWHDPKGVAALLREAAEAIEGARGYLIRNVLEPHNAQPLPDLIGVCTQVDHLCATSPLSTRLRAEVLEAIGPFAKIDTGDSPDEFALSMQTPDITCGSLRKLAALHARLSRAGEGAK